jgi:hypothetical protein
VTSPNEPTRPGDETNPMPAVPSTGASRVPTSPPPTSPPPTSPPPSSPPPASAPNDPDAAVVSGSEADRIRAEIEETRAELGETVDALSAKLDVKGRLDDKKAEVTEVAKAKVNEGVVTAKQTAARVQEVATDDQGKPTPPAIGAAAGVGALFFLILLIRRRRRKRRQLLD